MMDAFSAQMLGFPEAVQLQSVHDSCEAGEDV